MYHIFFKVTFWGSDLSIQGWLWSYVQYRDRLDSGESDLLWAFTPVFLPIPNSWKEFWHGFGSRSICELNAFSIHFLLMKTRNPAKKRAPPGFLNHLPSYHLDLTWKVEYFKNHPNLQVCANRRCGCHGVATSSFLAGYGSRCFVVSSHSFHIGDWKINPIP